MLVIAIMLIIYSFQFIFNQPAPKAKNDGVIRVQLKPDAKPAPKP